MTTFKTNIAPRQRKRKRFKLRRKKMPRFHKFVKSSGRGAGIIFTMHADVDDAIGLAIREEFAKLFTEVIKKIDGGWAVMHHTGKKKGTILKKHKTKKQALAQHVAIIMSKKRRGKS